jgi:hypothetical protein
MEQNIKIESAPMSGGKILFSSKSENEIKYKFAEPLILDEVQRYIDSTYTAHYTAGDPKNIQAIELIGSIGDGISFCRDSIIKYASRFGLKDGLSKKDALKIIHFGIWLYYFSFIDKPET